MGPIFEVITFFIGSLLLWETKDTNIVTSSAVAKISAKD
jgi:hypothetical protein